MGIESLSPVAHGFCFCFFSFSVEIIIDSQEAAKIVLWILHPASPRGDVLHNTSTSPKPEHCPSRYTVINEAVGLTWISPVFTRVHVVSCFVHLCV
jgi:hypothetical protein